MARRLATLILLALATATVGPRAWATDGAGFPEIDALYLAGEFEATAQRVNALLIRDQELAPERRAALYLMKARLELAFGRTGELKLWLAKAHREQPTMAIDPVKDPPSLVKAWDEVRAAVAPAAATSVKDAPDPEAATGHDARRALAYLPFGVAQANNQEPVKAMAVAGLQMSLLAVAASTDDGQARHLAFDLFLVSWIWSAYDGVGHRRDVTVGAVGTAGRGAFIALQTAF